MSRVSMKRTNAQTIKVVDWDKYRKGARKERDIAGRKDWQLDNKKHCMKLFIYTI